MEPGTGIFGTNFSGMDEALVGLLVFLIVAILLVGLVIIVLTTIINWKLLEKMGDEGWKSLIPVYNTWSLCEGLGLNPHWGWITVAAIIITPTIGIGILGDIICIYFWVIFCESLAKSFGKDTGFSVLLMLFYPITGFVLLSNEFLGKMPVRDLLFDDILKINKKEENVQTNNETVSEAKVEKDSEATSKFCSSCGKPVSDDAKFCINCGTEIK